MTSDFTGKNDSVFFCVGTNHRTADISTRERFYLNPEEVTRSLAEVVDGHQVLEASILSTCNRCEIFGVASRRFASESVLMNLFAKAHGIHDKSGTASANSRSLYTLTGPDAIQHAFRVASSMDSLIPGETQITGQFKDAMSLAREARTLGPLLGRLSQESLATAKKIRTQTDIGRHRVSISHAAIDLARRASDDLSSVSFLIIGAGEMARVAAEYAASYKPKSLMIANRTKQRAFELTEHIGYGDAHGLDNLYQLINKSDVVISATSARDFVINGPELRSALRSRGAGALFLIDIALPRNIDPDTAKLDDVYLFDIDDLKSVVDVHIGKRKEAIIAATDIVRESVESFTQWLSHHEVAPTLGLSSAYFKDLLVRESAKTLARDLFTDLNQRQKDALQAMLDSITAKITGDIAQALRGQTPDQARATADMLEQIFRKEP